MSSPLCVSVVVNNSSSSCCCQCFLTLGTHGFFFFRKPQKVAETNSHQQQKQLIQILLIVFADIDQILVNHLYTSVFMLYTPPAPPPQLLCMNNSPKYPYLSYTLSFYRPLAHSLSKKDILAPPSLNPPSL